MNRDALLATIIGFGIGLIITGVFLLGPNLSQILPNISFSLPSFSLPKSKPQVTPVPEQEKPKEPEKLTIDSPLPDAIEEKDSVLVSGRAKPGSLVIIQGQNDESIVRVKEDGKYAGTLSLIPGKNDILVVGYFETTQESLGSTMYYSPEEF